MKRKEKITQFKMGEHFPQPLDVEVFRYECVNVLGMKELNDDEVYTLAQHLIEYYYSIKISERVNLRYSVIEA